MSLKVKMASCLALAVSMMIAVFGTTGVAGAQDHTPVIVLPAMPQAPAAMQAVSVAQATATPGQPRITLEMPADTAAAPDTGAAAQAATQTAPQAASLDEMVAEQPQPSSLSSELQCLAGAIYFEAKGQALAGQLAVGRVVVNRAKSGRFPGSYCGVVYQRSQFGFIRGAAMPAIAKASRAWHRAVAVAQIAHAAAWPSQTEGALYFHATSVSPNWHRVRIARLEDHVFYR